MLAALKYAKFNSPIARRVLSLLYRENNDYRIPLGPLRGLRLHYDRTVNYHAILGLWDIEAYRFLERVLKDVNWMGPDRVIADLGANIGLFSLFASRRLAGKWGHVFAFEPAPYAASVLRKNLLLNSVGNVEIVEAACADKQGEIDFYLGHHHHTSSLLADWAANGGGPAPKIRVPAVTLDDFFFGETKRPAPDFIKMDIEGGGVLALGKMIQCVERKRPLLWIESHSPSEDRAISDLMLRTEYLAYRLQTRTGVTQPGATHPDPEGVWGTLLLYPSEFAALRRRLNPVAMKLS